MMEESEKNGRQSGNDKPDPPTSHPAPLTPHPSPTAARRAPRNWVWSFIGIALVAAILLIWLAIFISQRGEQQLTLDQLKASRKLWDFKGPLDYQMIYSVQRGGDPKRDRFFVEVRGGAVRTVVLNGAERLPEDQLSYHSMRSLLIFVQGFLEQDSRPESPKAQSRGNFSSDDGHLTWFVRRVIGQPERVEIRVEEFKVGAGK